MSRIVYVNGSYRSYGEASVHVEDRGLQFADSVYEVIEVCREQLVDPTRHLNRLNRSMTELAIPPPMSRSALLHIIRQIVRRNRVRDGIVYLQVTRGAAPRDFPFTGKDLKPTLICLGRSFPRGAREIVAASGISVQTMPDIRWGRCDIKTVMLLPAVLAKEQAQQAGASEAWLVDSDGWVTEGASSNAWIVNQKDELQTRTLSQELLPGITRHTLIDVAGELGIRVIEQAFRPQDAYTAKEAFNTSASATIMPVIRVDHRSIGSGKPGPLTMKLRQAFHHYAERMHSGKRSADT
jgi:D-alanine transaminase